VGPFRYQAAAGDCFPTSMVNAVAALYPFPRVPSAVIQRIYQYALDDESDGGGTSDASGRFLAAWLGDYRRKGFALSTEFLQGPEVRLEPRGKIRRHLKAGGVAVFDTYNSTGARHSILALRAGAEAIDFWDPRYQARAARHGGGRSAVSRFTPAGPEEPNLRVSIAWLEKTVRKAYALGPLADRCAILLKRA
jgi:hypothetical protein